MISDDVDKVYHENVNKRIKEFTMSIVRLKNTFTNPILIALNFLPKRN